VCVQPLPRPLLRCLLPAQVLPFRQACEEQADTLAPIVAQLDGKLVGWRH
jgi:hypothetical protein